MTPPGSPAPLLGTQGVRYAYAGSDRPALDGVTCSVTAGRRLAVLGPNGCGKSTLFLHLVGVLRPDRGEVRLDGAPVRYSRSGLAALRSQVGLVLQDPDDQLFSASVVQDVSFGPLNLGIGEDETRARIADVLEALGLTDLADRPTHALSHGQRRRVAIAGVLAMQPRAIVLDEPTAGLDARGTDEVLAALEVLADRGTTLVMATHDLDLAWSWADDVLVLHEGVVVAAGSAVDVLGDVAVLDRVRFRPPAVVRVLSTLRARGVVAADTPSPRSLDELLELLDGRVRPPAP